MFIVWDILTLYSPKISAKIWEQHCYKMKSNGPSDAIRQVVSQLKTVNSPKVTLWFWFCLKLRIKCFKNYQWFKGQCWSPSWEIWSPTYEMLSPIKGQIISYVQDVNSYLRDKLLVIRLFSEWAYKMMIPRTFNIFLIKDVLFQRSTINQDVVATV